MATNETIDGIPISPGLAAGAPCPWGGRDDGEMVQRSISGDEVHGEFQRLLTAIHLVEKKLDDFASDVERKLDQKLADVFRAQRTMLADEALRNELKMEMGNALTCAEGTVVKVLRRWSAKLSALDEDSSSRHAEDVEDLERRILKALKGEGEQVPAVIPPGSILVAGNVLPSDTIHLNDDGIAGLALERGGQGSHAALLARGFGIPAISGVENISERLDAASFLLVDGDSGRIIVDPSPSVETEFRSRMAARREKRKVLVSRCRQPAVTRDGVEIRVMANVSGPEGVARAVREGADGIGLLRMENMFMRMRTLPGEDVLVDTLIDAASRLDGKPLVARVLDVGGDKRLPFVSLPVEPNPQLGRRGVRLMEDCPELFELQLRAIARAWSERGNVRVMIPMVTMVEEVVGFRRMIGRVARDAGLSGIPPLGVMIETPAAALFVEDIAEVADFLSVGTNDLTQYVMAAGRNNPAVSDYYIDGHPAVLRMIEMIVAGARGKPVSVCGNVAARTEMVPELLRLGFRELSVPPPRIPDVKEAARAVDLSDAETS